MAKGGRGGSVFNGPSRTGNPSGKGRGNNPARSNHTSGGFGFTGGGGSGITVSTEPPSAAELAYDAAMAKLDAGVQQTHDAVRAIRSARETLPADQASAVEAKLLSTLRPQQSKMVIALLKAPESAFSKAIRAKR